MSYPNPTTPPRTPVPSRPVSEATRKMLSAAKQRGRNPRSRHVTIIAPNGRVGGLRSILETAAFFGVHQRTMEARIRRSYDTKGHPGWEIPGKTDGLYRAYFTDKGDPGNGEHRLTSNSDTATPTTPTP